MNKNMPPLINIFRVFDCFIENPAKPMFYDDLKERGLLEETCESRITEVLRYLEKQKVMEKSRSCGNPRGLKQERKKNFYKLKLTEHAFSFILNLYAEKSIEGLLKSKYCNLLIREIGFIKFFEHIKEKLASPDIKQTTSTTLFKHKATIEEYKLIAEELKREILTVNYVAIDEPKPLALDVKEHMQNLAQEITLKPIEHIPLLSNFDPLNAVRFYRETINKPLTDAYNELAKKSTITKGLADFLAFDNYLSPLTAHPMNSVKRILFSKTFERIYEDAYLLDGEALGVLSGRAAAIYNSFSDFLYEYFKNDSYGKEDRKIITKEMIYSWNVASTRFDIVCSVLAELYEDKIGSGNYHLWSDGLSYNITDLESGKSLLSPDIASSLLMFGSTPLTIKPDPKDSKKMVGEIMRKPFTVLRPCYKFKDMGWRSDTIAFDVILKELEQKMENGMQLDP